MQLPLPPRVTPPILLEDSSKLSKFLHILFKDTLLLLKSANFCNMFPNLLLAPLKPKMLVTELLNLCVYVDQVWIYNGAFSLD